MGTHGRGRLGSAVMGSVAQRVVHLSTVPVTLVK
jgi:nucleotide-binding universal stress UspA family protein